LGPGSKSTHSLALDLPTEDPEFSQPLLPVLLVLLSRRHRAKEFGGNPATVKRSEQLANSAMRLVVRDRRPNLRFREIELAQVVLLSRIAIDAQRLEI
jgi:hypothetical protein